MSNKFLVKDTGRPTPSNLLIHSLPTRPYWNVEWPNADEEKGCWQRIHVVSV